MPMKIEEGVMIMLDGKAWGVTYEDGHSTSYGWIAPEGAKIRDPKYCRCPADATYRGSYLMKELRKGKIVPVKRTTTVTTLDGQPL